MLMNVFSANLQPPCLTWTFAVIWQSKISFHAILFFINFCDVFFFRQDLNIVVYEFKAGGNPKNLTEWQRSGFADMNKAYPVCES